MAAAEAGLVIAMVRTNDEFRKERQYTEVLSRMPLIRLEKIGESEPMPFKRDVQVGMRSTILDDSAEDRAKLNRLLKDADVFFANKRPGFLERNGFGAEKLCAKKPGLIHAIVVLHGEKGPWSNRPGFDEIGAAVAGLFSIEKTPTHSKSAPIVPICDNVVGWLGTVGVLAALRRRAIEGGELSSRRVSDQNRAVAAFAWHL